MFEIGKHAIVDLSTTQTIGGDKTFSGTTTFSGATNINALLTVTKTTQQFSLNYDGSNKAAFTVSSGGDLTIAPTGLDTSITGNLAVSVNASAVDITSTGFIIRSVTAGITASTTQTQGQGALTKEFNQVSVCANANDTVTLPVAAAGKMCAIVNNGAQTLKIFPASGDNLGAGVDTATTLAAAGKAIFIAYDATTWIQFI